LDSTDQWRSIGIEIQKFGRLRGPTLEEKFFSPAHIGRAACHHMQVARGQVDNDITAEFLCFPLSIETYLSRYRSRCILKKTSTFMQPNKATLAASIYGKAAYQHTLQCYDTWTQNDTSAGAYLAGTREQIQWPNRKEFVIRWRLMFKFCHYYISFFPHFPNKEVALNACKTFFRKHVASISEESITKATGVMKEMATESWYRVTIASFKRLKMPTQRGLVFGHEVFSRDHEHTVLHCLYNFLIFYDAEAYLPDIGESLDTLSSMQEWLADQNATLNTRYDWLNQMELTPEAQEHEDLLSAAIIQAEETEIEEAKAEKRAKDIEIADAIQKRNPLRTAWGILKVKDQVEAKRVEQELKAARKIKREILRRPQFWEDHWAMDDQAEALRIRKEKMFNEAFADLRDILPDSPETSPPEEYSTNMIQIMEQIFVFVDYVQNSELNDGTTCCLKALVDLAMIEKAGIVTPLAFKIGVLCSFFKPEWQGDPAKQRASLLSWCSVTIVATFSIYMEAFHEFCSNPTSSYRSRIDYFCDERVIGDTIPSAILALNTIARTILDCDVVRADVFVPWKRPEPNHKLLPTDVLNTQVKRSAGRQTLWRGEELPSPVTMWECLPTAGGSRKKARAAKKMRGLNKTEQERTYKIMLSARTACFQAGLPTLNSEGDVCYLSPDDDARDILNYQAAPPPHLEL
jgi:hypothetical protein